MAIGSARLRCVQDQTVTNRVRSTLGPAQQGIEGGTQILPPRCQRIIDTGWHLMVNEAAYDPIRFQLPKLLDQHLLRDARNGSFQIRESLNLTAEQLEENNELPTAFKNPKDVLDASRARLKRIDHTLTFL